MITLIAAVGENNELGKNNDLLWHLPNDFKRFKAFTTGHHIIMGRKTFESFPKPLPNRTHIIITRNKEYKVPEGCLLASGIEQAITICPKNETIFIIGGGEIFKQSIHLADYIYLTLVHATFEGDALFPNIDPSVFQLIDTRYFKKDDKHQYDYSFLIYKKILATDL